jgi:hypothetical protein
MTDVPRRKSNYTTSSFNIIMSLARGCTVFPPCRPAPVLSHSSHTTFPAKLRVSPWLRHTGESAYGPSRHSLLSTAWLQLRPAAARCPVFHRMRTIRAREAWKCMSPDPRLISPEVACAADPEGLADEKRPRRTALRPDAAHGRTQTRSSIKATGAGPVTVCDRQSSALLSTSHILHPLPPHRHRHRDDRVFRVCYDPAARHVRDLQVEDALHQGQPGPGWAVQCVFYDSFTVSAS